MTISLPGAVRLRPHGRDRSIEVGGTVASVPAFNPSTISGMRGWWKADAITGKVNGNPISQWDDVSGNARHLTQATGSLQPLYVTGAKNGLPGVSFDGVDDFMATATSPWTVRQTTSFIVVKATGGVGVKSVLWDASTYFELRATEVWQYESSGYKTIASGDFHTDYAVLTLVADHDVGLTSYLNGAQVGSAVTGSTYPTAGATYLGGRTASHQATCIVLERLEYGLVSTSDRQSVEAYLKAKWGTA